MFDGIESVEMSNNVFYRRGGGGVEVYVDRSATWKTGAALISGANNWVPTGSSALPAAWTGTVQGADPGFTNLGSLDLRPASNSPLVNAGSSATPSPAGHPFPRPLAAPQSSPVRSVRAASRPLQRPVAGAIDIGAYESGSSLAALAMRTADSDRDLGDSDSSAAEEEWNVDGDAAPSDGETGASDTDDVDASEADAEGNASAGDCAADDDAAGDDTAARAAACSEAAQGNADAPHDAHASSCSVGGALAGGPVAGSGAFLAGATALLGAALRRRGPPHRGVSRGASPQATSARSKRRAEAGSGS